MDLKDLLKLSKSTKLVITKVEDDSSETTVVKILHLQDAVTAVGSVPLPNGSMPQLKTATVYVAADNIDEFLKDAVIEEVNGVPTVTYNGQMHLDVSKPKTNTNNTTGETRVTVPAKIWLTKNKFSRSGNDLRKKQSEGRNSVLTAMFGTGKIAEQGTEDLGANVKDLGVENKATPEPVVVGEQGKKPEKTVKTP